MKPATCIDFETYYDKQGANVVDLGEYNYTHHPKFEAYLVSVVGEGISYVGHPKDFDWDKIRGHELVAHNARFDQAVAEVCAPEWVAQERRWNDTADLSSYLLVGRSLAEASANLYPEQAVDKSLRSWMCGKTWADAVAAGKGEALKQYALTDAQTAHRIWMDHHAKWLPLERTLSEHTRELGRVGIRIDRAQCEKILGEMEEIEFAALKALPWVTRDGEKALSLPALRAECRLVGVPPPASTDDKSEEFQTWLEAHGSKVPFVQAFKDLKKINTHKSRVETMLRCARPDNDRWSYGLRYYGALPTGRWAAGSGGGETSTGNVQNQNRELALDKYDLRHLLVPAPGKKFIIADYSSIEPVVTAYFVGDQALLQAVQNNEDIYEAYARSRGLYSGSEPLKAHKELRGRVKGAVLSCCYCVGPARLSQQYGMPLADAERVVADYRRMNPKVTGMWRKLERALADTVMSRNPAERQVEIELPSGRTLRYLDVQRREGQYLGRKSRAKRDVHTNLYGGRLFNACLTGDTEVLTERGWVMLTSVTLQDRVWDGEAWVSHEGLVFNGVKETLTLSGVRMTPDHLVMTSAGWKAAGSINRWNVSSVTLPDTDAPPPNLYEAVYDLVNAGPRHRFTVRGTKPFLVHNCIQGTARDVLGVALNRLHQAGLQVVMHVHDEVVVEVDAAEAEDAERAMKKLMTEPMPWAPTMPLRTESHIVNHYQK